MSQWLGIVGAGLLVVALILFLRRASDGAGYKIEKELLSFCQGDRAMMERLIAQARDGRPDASRAEAARAAVESFRRDNR